MPRIDADFAMKRSATLDMCRALLFVLMLNTHALTVANVPQDHWLRADFWLPNGWATMVFVVLTGFSVGAIYGARPPLPERDRAIRLRAWEIFLVMVLSNALFCVLRLSAEGNAAVALSPGFWLGFLTLDTQWSISGVLMPTVLVLLCFPLLQRCIASSPWATIAVLLALRLLAGALSRELGPSHTGWAGRFFLTQGLGGFPVLLFVLNGAMGAWLAIIRRHQPPVWKSILLALLLVQLAIYFTDTYFPSQRTEQWFLFMRSFGALGKFAWMFIVARTFVRIAPAGSTKGLTAIGRNALGSFVLHRICLHGLAAVLAAVASGPVPAGLQYAFLASATLFLIWALCASREQVNWVHVSLRRLAL